MTRHRSRFEVILDILKVCRQPSSITKVVYRANLNFVMFRRYRRGLLEKGLLRLEGKKVQTTEQGLRLLQQGREILPVISA